MYSLVNFTGNAGYRKSIKTKFSLWSDQVDVSLARPRWRRSGGSTEFAKDNWEPTQLQLEVRSYHCLCIYHFTRINEYWVGSLYVDNVEAHKSTLYIYIYLSVTMFTRIDGQFSIMFPTSLKLLTMSPSPICCPSTALQARFLSIIYLSIYLSFCIDDRCGRP